MSIAVGLVKGVPALSGRVRGMGEWRIDGRTEHRSRVDWLAPVVTIVICAVLWVLVLRLAAAFIRSDLTYEYVAGNSRRGSAWPYRIAGVWGGMEGSLLLFAAIVSTAGALVARQQQSLTRWFAPLCSTLLAGISLVIANPFDRLDVPAVEGFGLNPILLHPAMTIHPPLLYCGLAATLPVYLGVPRARTWLLAAMALLTAAMTLGGFWSYVEQGWGGYWGWDPVENASLATWMATLIAIHAGRGATRRALALQRLPVVVALAGAGVARSGLTSSVHSFAEAGRVGGALGLVALVALAVAAADLRHRAPAARLDTWQLMPTVLISASLAIVTVLTLAPVLASIGSDGEGARLSGSYFARTLGPFAVVALVALAAMLARAPRRAPPAAWVAHAGMAVLLLGVAGSTFDRTGRADLATGTTVEVAGVSLTSTGVTVNDDPSSGTSEVAANLIINGTTRSPSLVAYPERGGVLAETALVTRPWRDVQLVLISARDDGRVLVEVHSKPLVELIWLGAAIVLVGAALSSRRRRDPAAVGSEPACATAAR